MSPSSSTSPKTSTRIASRLGKLCHLVLIRWGGSGFANFHHNRAYATVNFGVSREFQLAPTDKPRTVRFDFVNLCEKAYELRDGSGIGVFAPQFGPRRDYYAGISQRF